MVIIRQFKTIDTLALHTLKLLRETLLRSGSLMLSGGSTPYAIYNQLAATPCSVHPGRTLFLSDERMVPTNSPDNNANHLKPMLLALDCEDRFIRVNTELPPQTAATRFADELESLRKIDLGFLGMGTDGHTAGFFTHEQAILKTGTLALHTDRPDGMQGVSVTPALFQQVERIILLVTGEAKRDIINTLLNAPKTIPAGIALSSHPHVELWTDVQL